MTGLTFPAAMSSHMIVKSSFFGLAKKVTNFWPANRVKTSAVIKRAKMPTIARPVRSPTMTHVPLGFKTRLQADNEWFPTQSKIRS